MNVQQGLPLSDARVGVVACGALAHDIAEISAERDWSIRIYPLPPLLHNHPQKIAGAVEEALAAAAGKHQRLAVAYADCGTYGALDDVCSRWGVARLGGQHCYDVYAGVAEVSAWLAREPGTYLLTDYLVASFHRSVVVELGLDRYPELRDDYFGNYRRAIWITQRQTPLLAQAASLGRVTRRDTTAVGGNVPSPSSWSAVNAVVYVQKTQSGGNGIWVLPMDAGAKP